MILKFIKKYYLPLAVSCLMLLILVTVTLVFFPNRSSYDTQGTNLTTFKEVETLDVDQDGINTIEQTFQATNDNLNMLSLAVVNPQYNNTIGMTIVTWPENDIITDQQINIPINESFQYITIQFPPVQLSKGKNYKFIINPSDSQTLSFVTIEKNRYPAGKLLINEKESDDTLVFNFQYYNDNILHILLNRLSTYKPWFFQHFGSFILLYILLIVLITILSFFLTKEIIKGPDQES